MVYTDTPLTDVYWFSPNTTAVVEKDKLRDVEPTDARRLSRRAPDEDDYWLLAFAYLRRRYGHLPCVTFLPATSYTRLEEVAEPAHGRGIPQWHPDNRKRGKSARRGQVQQTLDFVSALRHASAFSPSAHIMTWEDDCNACTGTLATAAGAVAALAAADPHWGALRLGNGGSGLLFAADAVPLLLPYLAMRRGSENVDVSMWRYLHSGGRSDYLARHTWSAHRGQRSSFKLYTEKSWQRVRCGAPLDYHWGFYSACNATNATEANSVLSANNPDVRLLQGEFLCSVFSPLSNGLMPVEPSKEPSRAAPTEHPRARHGRSNTAALS
jgi:hypothetical protein